MKHLLLILFSWLAFGYAAICQTDLHGSWYMFSRNRIIRLNFSGDSLYSDQLAWNLSPLYPLSHPDTTFIIQRITAHQRQYVLSTQPGDTTRRIHVGAYTVITPSSEISLAVNLPDSGYLTTAEAENFISTDTGRKYGILLYSESDIHAMQAQKRVSEMTANDFKTYVANILAMQAQLVTMSKLPNSANSLVYYAYAMGRTLLAKMGFNPVVANDEIDQMFRRFQNDPETKDAFHN